MKKFSRWLLRNNIHIMTLIFLGWAVWAICNWNTISIVQKLVMGAYFLITLHEYEEALGGGLVKIFCGVQGIDPNTLPPGESHIAPATYITVLFSLSQLFPDILWLVFPIFILGIFEGLIHTMGIFIFKLGKPSPGWYTAIVMLGFSIWSIVVINQNIDYAPIQWLWTALYYIGSFLLLEVWFQHLLGSNIQRFAKAMRSHMIKNVLKR